MPITMILCVGLTPTVERNLITPNFGIGGFYRVQEEIVFAAGKGINVARTIKNLGGETFSIGFLGGYTGQSFKNMTEAEGLAGCWTPIRGETRQSYIIINPEGGQDATSLTHFGPTIRAEEWEQFTLDLFEVAKNARDVSISGTVPPGIEAEQFENVIARLREQGKRAWLDSSGPWLEAGLKAGPFAIKVNAKEISELTQRAITGPGEALKSSRDVRRQYGLSAAIVTLGPNGSVCSSEEGDWIVHPIHYPKIVSSVGSGDAFLGGWLRGYDAGLSMEECLRMASAAAAANTQKLGPGCFELDDYQRALERVVVEKV